MDSTEHDIYSNHPEIVKKKKKSQEQAFFFLPNRFSAIVVNHFN